MCYIIFTVAGNGSDVEPFDIVESFFSIPIDHIIYGTFVILLEDIDIKDIFADKHFICHTDHLVLAVFIEDDHIVNV